jgi:Xaa-Pro aminopeptidase
MKYPCIDKHLFEKNRENFTEKLSPNSIAIFQSNDEFPRSGDQTHIFKQNADLFYLSGIDQEQTILLLFPDCPNPLYKEILFIRQTNEHIAVWEGHKLTVPEAKNTSGIKNVYWLEEFWNILPSIISYADNIYLNTNENDRYVHQVPYQDIRFIEKIKNLYPLHKYERAALIMRELRPVKSEIEIELTKKACEITRDAFVRILKFIKPGVAEYEIEAEIIHEFLRQRSSGHAYNPIIASGKNANILHYNDNNQICKDGDVILFDFGAEYANYNADMSRSVPVNGRFSKRQKDVYSAVLRIMKEARKMLLPATI